MKRTFSTRAAALFLTALLLSSSGCLRLKRIPDSPETESAAPETISPETNAPETEKPETIPPETESAETDAPAPETEKAETDPAAAVPEPAAPDPVDEERLSMALALGLVGWGKEYLDDPNGLWNVIGYYAALTALNESPEAVPWLSDATAQYIAGVLRAGEDPLPEPLWLDDGDSAKKEAREGVSGISFPGYRNMLTSMLGVWRSLSVSLESGTYIVSVEDHLDDGLRTCLVYAAFADAGEGENTVRAMPYLMITDFITPEGLPVTDPADNPEGYPGGLNDDGRGEDEKLADQLTWENLTAANLVEKLVFTYGGFKTREMSYLDGALSNASDSCYLVDDPGIMSVTEGQAVDGEGNPYTYTSYSFWDGENVLYASVGGDGISASVFADPWTQAENAEHYPGDNQFFYEFYNAPAEILFYDDDTVTFTTAPEILDGETLRYTVLRETLAVLSYERYAADGTLTYARVAEYGRDRVTDFMAPLRQNVSDQRIVRLNVVWYDGGDESRYELFLHVPREWQLTVLGTNGLLFLYETEGMSGSVDNPIPPGSDDLTLWGTNAAG